MTTRDFTAGSGDAARWWLELAARLAPRCEDFAVLCCGPRSERAAASFEQVEMGSARQRAQARERFDVVLGADWVSALPALAWRASGFRGRVFAAAFGPELLAGGRWPLGAWQRRSREVLLGRCDGVLALTPPAQARLAARGVRSVLVPFGVDLDRFRPAARGALARELGLIGRRVLLGVGALVPERRLESVLYAVSALGIRYPDLRYVLAGDGPERARLELLAERLRIGHKVRFLGRVAPAVLPAVYNLADVLVQLGGDAAALADASSSAALEALACGKPVVTAAGSSAAALVDEHTGRRVPDGDGSALAAALVELLEQPALARELGARGRQRVIAHATWEQVAERCRRALELQRPPACRSGGSSRDAELSSEPRAQPASPVGAALGAGELEPPRRERAPSDAAAVVR